MWRGRARGKSRKVTPDVSSPGPKANTVIVAEQSEDWEEKTQSGKQARLRLCQESQGIKTKRQVYMEEDSTENVELHMQQMSISG